MGETGIAATHLNGHSAGLTTAGAALEGMTIVIEAVSVTVEAIEAVTVIVEAIEADQMILMAVARGPRSEPIDYYLEWNMESRGY